MNGHPTFNHEKLTKRAKRQVGFVLQVRMPSCASSLKDVEAVLARL